MIICPGRKCRFEITFRAIRRRDSDQNDVTLVQDIPVGSCYGGRWKLRLKLSCAGSTSRCECDLCGEVLADTNASTYDASEIPAILRGNYRRGGKTCILFMF